jgi:hypothetical protein
MKNLTIKELLIPSSVKALKHIGAWISQQEKLVASTAGI